MFYKTANLLILAAATVATSVFASHLVLISQDDAPLPIEQTTTTPIRPDGQPEILTQNLGEPMGTSKVALSADAIRGRDYAKQYGIDWVTFTIIRHGTRTDSSGGTYYIDKTIAEVHFTDGRVLTNPSVANNDVVNNSEQFSMADELIYRAIRIWNNETD